ncbi:MAG: hypothetical protein Q9166_006731 [cf. Caloplaca sp. 2 TL-2023]
MATARPQRFNSRDDAEVKLREALQALNHMQGRPRDAEPFARQLVLQLLTGWLDAVNVSAQDSRLQELEEWVKRRKNRNTTIKAPNLGRALGRGRGRGRGLKRPGAGNGRNPNNLDNPGDAPGSDGTSGSDQTSDSEDTPSLEDPPTPDATPEPDGAQGQGDTQDTSSGNGDTLYSGQNDDETDNVPGASQTDGPQASQATDIQTSATQSTAPDADQGVLGKKQYNLPDKHSDEPQGTDPHAPSDEGIERHSVETRGAVSGGAETATTTWDASNEDHNDNNEDRVSGGRSKQQRNEQQQQQQQGHGRIEPSITPQGQAAQATIANKASSTVNGPILLTNNGGRAPGAPSTPVGNIFENHGLPTPTTGVRPTPAPYGDQAKVDSPLTAEALRGLPRHPLRLSETPVTRAALEQTTRSILSAIGFAALGTKRQEAVLLAVVDFIRGLFDAESWWELHRSIVKSFDRSGVSESTNETYTEMDRQPLAECRDKHETNIRNNAKDPQPQTDRPNSRKPDYIITFTRTWGEAHIWTQRNAIAGLTTMMYEQSIYTYWITLLAVWYRLPGPKGFYRNVYTDEEKDPLSDEESLEVEAFLERELLVRRVELCGNRSPTETPKTESLLKTLIAPHLGFPVGKLEAMSDPPTKGRRPRRQHAINKGFDRKWNNTVARGKVVAVVFNSLEPGALAVIQKRSLLSLGAPLLKIVIHKLNAGFPWLKGFLKTITEVVYNPITTGHKLSYASVGAFAEVKSVEELIEVCANRDDGLNSLFGGLHGKWNRKADLADSRSEGDDFEAAAVAANEGGGDDDDDDDDADAVPYEDDNPSIEGLLAMEEDALREESMTHYEWEHVNTTSQQCKGSKELMTRTPPQTPSAGNDRKRFQATVEHESLDARQTKRTRSSI